MKCPRAPGHSCASSKETWAQGQGEHPQSHSPMGPVTAVGLIHILSHHLSPIRGGEEGVFDYWGWSQGGLCWGEGLN